MPKVSYNAPFVLTFTFACVLFFGLDLALGGYLRERYLSILPGLPPGHPLTWLRLAAHIFGHAHLQHLVYNLSIILLIGPILEEKYGAGMLVFMTLVTALSTGLVTLFLLPKGLMGASGLVFALILLGSFVNVKSGTIPLTFILVSILFLGNEFFRAGSGDGIARFAHITGGVCGALCGFYKARPG